MWMRKWKNAEGRRKDMKGIAQGIDRSATRALIEKRSTSDKEKGYIRVLLEGGEHTCNDLGRMKLNTLCDDPTSRICPYCDEGVIETTGARGGLFSIVIVGDVRVSPSP